MRLGAFLAVLFAVELVWALRRSTGGDAQAAAGDTSVAAIGRALFTTYAFPFEVTSLLILVAMVGAVVLARPGGQAGK
jgi:NADH-quinone oxidoreductase subunit J